MSLLEATEARFDARRRPDPATGPEAIVAMVAAASGAPPASARLLFAEPKALDHAASGGHSYGSDAEFVVGSAVPHDHDLVLGHYSVHTSAYALREGEARISAIQARLIQEGRL